MNFKFRKKIFLIHLLRWWTRVSCSAVSTFMLIYSNLGLSFAIPKLLNEIFLIYIANGASSSATILWGPIITEIYAGYRIDKT